MPRVDNVKYETTKDKVIAWLSKQTASVFTKLAMEYKQLAADLELMNKMKRELNALQNSTKDRETSINAQLKERIPELFNESEQLMTLSVECLGSSFTLSKFTESNKDKVITPAGEIISTDYKAIVEQLLIQGGELSEAVKLLIKQFSVIAESDVIKKGAERRLTVNLESIVQEGVWDKVKSIINRLSAKFKSLFSGLRSRQNKIDSMLRKLNESNNKGKIMLNRSEKQLVKEYAKKLISKRKLNENSTTSSFFTIFYNDISDEAQVWESIEGLKDLIQALKELESDENVDQNSIVPCAEGINDKY